MGDTVQIGADFNTLISTWLYKRKLTGDTGDLWPIENCIYYTFQDTFYSFVMSINTDNFNLTILFK